MSIMVYVLLVAGFVLLIKGADFFVEASSSVAKALRVPSIIIGLTIVAFGTSMPELAVSTTASLAGNNEIAVGNVIGSNIFNLLVLSLIHISGRSGEISMDFYYPRELTQDQWVTVYVDREPEIYLQFEQELMHTAIQVRPYQVVQLRFETNFYVPDAQEQRGVRKLAAILKLTAD